MERLDAFFTVSEAAAFLGIAPNTIRNWGRDQKIHEYRHPVNNYRLYKKKDLERVLKSLRRPSRFSKSGKRSTQQV